MIKDTCRLQFVKRAGGGRERERESRGYREEGDDVSAFLDRRPSDPTVTLRVAVDGTRYSVGGRPSVWILTDTVCREDSHCGSDDRKE